jgi:hypothetical protein
MLYRVEVTVREYPNLMANSTAFIVVTNADSDDEAEQKAIKLLQVHHRGSEKLPAMNAESHGTIEYVIFNAQLNTMVAEG